MDFVKYKERRLADDEDLQAEHLMEAVERFRKAERSGKPAMIRRRHDRMLGIAERYGLKDFMKHLLNV